jgi:hypothetical protein
MKARLHLIVGVLVAAALTASPDASAQDRVAVLGFSGPQGPAARNGVVRALREECEVVDVREWQQAAQKLGARGSSADALARVAAELGVKAIVSGGVNRVGRQFSLSVIVRDGADGSQIGREGRSMSSAAHAGGAGSALGRRILELVREARGASGGGSRPPPEDEGDEPEPEEPPEDEEEPEEEDYSNIEEERPPGFEREGDREVRQAADAEDVARGGRTRGRERERANEPAREREPGQSSPDGWLEFGLEINGASRTFSVPIDQTIDNSGRSEARFESSVFPEIGARLSFYPGGIFTDNWAAGIGIDGSFHHHLFLRVLNRRRNEEVESEEYAFTVGVNYRIVLGNADRGLTLWPRVGFGRFSFFLGDVGNDIVPPFVYDHIYIGLNAYIPIATRYVGIDMGADYLAVLSIGPHATAAYNASGQLPTTHGFQILIGLSGQIVAGLRWRLGFEMLGFISEHQGVGQGWGYDPTTRIDTPSGRGIRTMDKATDIFFRLMPQLSYRFGWRPAGGARSSDDGGTRDGSARSGSWYDNSRGGDEQPEEEEEDWGDW